MAWVPPATTTYGLATNAVPATRGPAASASGSAVSATGRNAR